MTDHPTHPARRDFLKGAGLDRCRPGPGRGDGSRPSSPPQSPSTGRDPSPGVRQDRRVGLRPRPGRLPRGLRALRSQEAIALVREAVDAGVTFFDNAWEYHEGKSEEWMGKALEGRRDKAFLMTKVCTHGRDKKVAMTMLEESLKRLKTDHLDLWQVHECVYDNDPERHFAKDGVIEALDLAKKQGKVRFVGFTGHKNPAIHLKMLSYNYPFDAVQMPLNPFDATYRSFETKVLPELVARGIAPLGMKSLGGNGQPVQKGVLTAEEALRYAMSLPVAVTISGVDSLAVLAGRTWPSPEGFRPMPPDEMASLRARGASPKPATATWNSTSPR